MVSDVLKQQRFELSIYPSVGGDSHRSVVCQAAVLRELHTSDPGIVRMKSLARIHVWWPGMDKKMIYSCEVRVSSSPASWSWPDKP